MSMGTLERLIRFSLRHRLLVCGAALLLLVAGGAVILRMPLDIFPDLSTPTVTIIAEATGLAPEEVEAVVTFPIESAINGAPRVERIRSVSADGIAVIWVEMHRGTDLYLARQILAERLQEVHLPAGVERPKLGPISSIMGEITFIALTSETVSPLVLRQLAETAVARTLLAVPGVSQVVPIGGDQRELQVTVQPTALAQRRISLEEVLAAVTAAGQSTAAGFHVEAGQEYLVRATGRVRQPEEVAAVVVRTVDGVPVRVGDVATVAWGALPRRGTASYNTHPAVVLSVQKQPGVNTLALTATLDQVLADIQGTLPPGVVIETENFRQADFIAVAVANVTEALRDGGLLVVVILFLFLGSVRTTLISVLAIPLSLVAGVVVLSLLAGDLNTMTLGGLTIAIGLLVDDAIIVVESVFRRLRQAAAEDGTGAGRSPQEVVAAATVEVVNPILFATLITMIVFLPIFFLPGIEGQLLRPLGLAFLLALAASLLVALTATPVLCLLLLPGSRGMTAREPWLQRAFLRAYKPTLRWSFGHPRWVVATAIILTVVAAVIAPTLGRSFLPPFNEGALTVSVISPPGTPLEEGDRLGRQVEETLLAFPEVRSTSRRSGRAERDEHIQGVNASELEVVLGPLEHGRTKEQLVAQLRQAVAMIPGASVSFGQPISHRIDHMISGSRTNLAIKIFGPDFAVARTLSGQLRQLLEEVPGIVDLSNQEQASVPQLTVDFDRAALARHGLTPGAMATAVEALFQGVPVGDVVEAGLVSPLVVRFPPELRGDIDRLRALPVTSPAGDLLRLDRLANVRTTLGPSLIRRENVERVAMVTANIEGADLAGTVARVEAAMAANLVVPEGYRITLGGQFEEAVRSARNLGILAVLILIALYALLYLAFGNARDTWIVLVNLPLALIGGVFALALTGGVLSVATAVGFVTLFGIATRNGVLLVTQYQRLEGEGLNRRDAVLQGSRERLAPILMTALTAGLALVPLVLAGGAPGNEIQSPMALVILGGLLSSTFLNLVVVPVLYGGGGKSGDTQLGSLAG